MSCATDRYSDTPDLHDWREWQSQEKPFPFLFHTCKKCPAVHIQGERFVSFDSDHVAPDYLNDRNATFAAAQQLGEAVIKAMRFWLFELCGEMKAHHATATQEAEAIVRSIGKWEDS